MKLLISIRDNDIGLDERKEDELIRSLAVVTRDGLRMWLGEIPVEGEPRVH